MKRLSAFASPKVLGLVALVGLAAGGATLAATAREPTAKSTEKSTAETAFTPKLQLAEKVVGVTVQNTRSEALGRIENLAVNLHQSWVPYALLSVTSMPDQVFPVPMTALQTKAGERTATLDVDKAKLQKAPTFGRANWSELSSDQTWRNVMSFYREASPFFKKQGEKWQAQQGMGETPSGGMAEGTGKGTAGGGMAEHPMAQARMLHPLYRLSDIIGTSVRAAQNEPVGNLEDLAIDLNHGHIAYGVISLDALKGMAHKQAMVPWQSLFVDVRHGTARLEADTPMLAAVAFEERAAPNLTDRKYLQAIYDRFGAEPYWQVYGYAPRKTEATRAERDAGWSADSELNRSFKAENVRTVTGTIVNVGSFRPTPSSSEGLRLRVQTSDGQIHTVLAAPLSFTEQSGTQYMNGDRIAVKGSLSEFMGAPALIASEIDKGGQVLRLRDERGKPMWKITP